MHKYPNNLMFFGWSFRITLTRTVSYINVLIPNFIFNHNHGSGSREEHSTVFYFVRAATDRLPFYRPSTSDTTTNSPTSTTGTVKSSRSSKEISSMVYSFAPGSCGNISSFYANRMEKIYQGKGLKFPEQFDSTHTYPPINFMQYVSIAKQCATG